MTLDELDKNSKFGYRRRGWEDTNHGYASFNGEEWIRINSRGTDCALVRTNAEADDWYLSDVPNKYHKRVAESEFPCFRRGKETGLVIEFFSPTSGQVVVSNTRYPVGHFSDAWVPYDDPEVWEPCEDPLPRQKLKESENTSCSSEPTTQHQHKKENTMDLRLLLAMMTAMSNEETPKDATNSNHVVIVTKDDAYEGYFYADSLESVKAIVAEPKNELKKFHVFDYQTTLGQKPRKVIEVDRC